jgi:hypothetical protein
MDALLVAEIIDLAEQEVLDSIDDPSSGSGTS